MNSEVPSQRIVYDQPFFFSINVSDKKNAKGDWQPEFSIVLSRKLEEGEKLFELLESDLLKVFERIKQTRKTFEELK